MADLCDLQIHINGQQTFFLNEKIISKFSGKLRKIIKQEKRRTQIKNSGIHIDDFPGGPFGFEQVSRFCYNDGIILVTVSNVCLLHCCAVFLVMTEKVSACNLLQQTEAFLEDMFSWSRIDILSCLRSCESFFSYADSNGLIEKLLNTLLAKIAQHSDMFVCSSSSSSSPDTIATPFRLSSSTKSMTPEVLGITKSSSKKFWWFDDLTILPPMIIERFVKILGGYGTDDTSLILTRFILNYLKASVQSKHDLMIKNCSNSEYSKLADIAVYGVLTIGKSTFSCRGLFWILRLVSTFGISRDCGTGLERLIASVLDQATLDDLLVSANDGSGVYDVNLVVRLIRLFVNTYSTQEYIQKMKKVGWLIDKYLREIAPDQNLKISRFLGVAESLADCARDCFDGVYRAVDIYLESHPCLSLEERSRLCRCLNYKKLSLEACKDLAKNPRVPPRVSVEALAAQSRSANYGTSTTHDSPALAPSPKNHDHIDHSYYYSSNYRNYDQITMRNDPVKSHNQRVMYNGTNESMINHKNNSDTTECDQDPKNNAAEENDEMRLNLQRMQRRVLELEKVCRKMKGRMSRMGKNASSPMISHSKSKVLPRLC
ncbi:BTB/POZ domain-containing protein [Heracleum sosnowskyi]|uniref:BTB/POZ domain-containing protein n=1 Tax=Heracleum sosnowskyi TaxID=360622 RepID=A0AAD8MUQ7_9APIA|nr:BTB/POZ domain-containing protein [Heracleum sosnowskyi]